MSLCLGEPKEQLSHVGPQWGSWDKSNGCFGLVFKCLDI